MPLQVNQTIKIEMNFMGPSPRVRDLIAVDTMAHKMQLPAVVTDARFYEQLMMVKLQRQSKYQVILLLDKEGTTFGLNKMYSVPSLQALDGIDVVLSRGRNAIELKNEINSIQQFLKMGRIKPSLRWGIIANAGQDHINNCVEAIRTTNTADDMIKMMVNPGGDIATIKAMVAECRKTIGRERTVIKFNTTAFEAIEPTVDNIRYDIDAAMLAASTSVVVAPVAPPVAANPQT